MKNTQLIVSLVQTVALSVLALTSAAHAQYGAGDGQWRHFGGDSGSTKYSSLELIDASNVADLEIAWRWQSVDGQFEIEKLKEDFPNLKIKNDVDTVSTASMKGAPLMVDGVLYVTTAFYQAAAIDANTGKTIWTHDPRSYASGIPTMMLGFSSRGLAYWNDGDRDHRDDGNDGDDGKRVLWGTGDGYLICANARDGSLCDGFGENGRVDLIAGFPRARRAAPINYSITSAPMIVGDVVVVGSAVSDQPADREMPPGHVRAFDVRTGELVWMFNTIPQPGEFGHDTWAPGAWEYSGNANVWSLMSADEELGYVYLPVGSPTNDFYGADRWGDNLFANSIVAVDGETGERVWHYQLVHHDLWDSDASAAPNLVDITVDGRRIKALAQVSKTGFTYVFDRATGKPVWPIEERPVPASDVPGEQASATQPFPSRPPAFDRQSLSPDDLIDFTPELREQAIAILAAHRHGEIFLPPSLAGEGPDATQGTINMPGYGGGANWHGAAFDPETGYLYVPSGTRPSRSGLATPDDQDATLDYVRAVSVQIGPDGLPLVKPPYGRITAIDLNKGEIAWQQVNGPGSPDVRRHPALAELDLPDLGSGRDHVLLTKTLLFTAQSGPNRDGDHVLVARDKATGDVVAEIPLPDRPGGPPVTYRVEDQQYIALPIRSTPPEIVALRLPRKTIAADH